MAMNRYDTVVDAISALRRRGFSSDFKLQGEHMHCLMTGTVYDKSDMYIVEYHRFEGESNPGDMSIVFAVECSDGNKGIVTSSYGPYADMDLVNFMSKVRIKQRPDGAVPGR